MTDAEKAALEHLARHKELGLEYSDSAHIGIFLAGVKWAAPKWIDVKERLPEPRTNVLRDSPSSGMSDEEAQAWAQMQAEAEAHEAEQAAAQEAEYQAAMEAEQAKRTMPPFKAWIAWQVTEQHLVTTLARSKQGCEDRLLEKVFNFKPFALHAKAEAFFAARDVELKRAANDGWRIVKVEVREVLE